MRIDPRVRLLDAVRRRPDGGPPPRWWTTRPPAHQAVAEIVELVRTR